MIHQLIVWFDLRTRRKAVSIRQIDQADTGIGLGRHGLKRHVISVSGPASNRSPPRPVDCRADVSPAINIAAVDLGDCRPLRQAAATS